MTSGGAARRHAAGFRHRAVADPEGAAAALEAARPQPHLVGQQLRGPAFADPIEDQERLAVIAAHDRGALMDARLDLAEPAPPTRRLALLADPRQILGHRVAAAEIGQL